MKTAIKSFLTLFFLPLAMYSQTTVTFSAGNPTFVVPAGITSIKVDAWGAGGAGGGSTNAGSLKGRGGAGGAGGAFASATISVPSGASLPIVVGNGAVGAPSTLSPGNNGGNGGFSTITGYTGFIYAAGGAGGAANTTGNTPLGGTGTTTGSVGTTKIAGGNGGNGVTTTWPIPGTSGAGGTGANGGGAGGVVVATGVTDNGDDGTAPGGGGSGARTSQDEGARTGGAGGRGRVKITYTCPTYTISNTTTSTVDVCSGTSSLITLSSTAAGLPVGLYSVAYQVQGVTQTPVSMNVTTAGNGTFIAGGFTTLGTKTITITGLTSGSSVTASENCTTTISLNNTATVSVISTSIAPVALAGTAATCTQITANWNAVSGTTYYELDVATNSGFTSFVSGYNDLNVGNTLTKNITGLNSNTTYYYRVRAYKGTCTSSNSSTITYKTIATPGTVTSTVATNTVCAVFNANWSAEPNATSYLLDVSTSNTFSTFVAGFNGLDVGNVLTKQVTGLSQNTTYYFRVRAKNSCGTSAAFSTTQSTTTLNATMPSTVTTKAASNTLCTAFNANWNAAANASSYLLDVSTSNTFSTFVSGYNGLDVGNVLTLQVTGLTPSTTYYYRVRAKNGCGTSANSGTSTNTTTISDIPDAPSSISTSNVYCTQFTISWGVSNVASSYTVERANDAGFSSGLVSVTGITTLTYTFNSLTAGTQYYYRVKAVNGCGTTASTSASITTPALPTTPTITASGSLTICQVGGSVVLTSSAGAGYLWSTGATTQSITVTAPGNYTVQTVNAGGCNSASSLVKTVTTDSLPTATAGGSQSICSNVSATVSGASATNGTILWTVSGGFGSLTNETTLTPTYTPVLGGGGTVVLTMTVTSNNSCSPQIATATYTLFIQAPPKAATTESRVICELGSATVSGATATGGTLLWTHDGTGTLTGATTQTPTYTAAAGDTGKLVTLTMTVTASPVCSTPYIAVNTFPIQVRANLSAVAVTPNSNQAICGTDSGSTLTVAVTGGNGTTYQWGKRSVSGGAITPISGATASTYAPTGAELTAGTWLVVCTATPACGSAIVSNEVSVTVNSIPAAPTVTTIQPDCTNTTGTLTVTSPAPASGITYTLIGTSPVVAAITNATGVFSGLAAGTYNVTVNTGSGCSSTVTSVTINTAPTNTWNGSAWSNGAPNNAQALVIAGNYSSTGNLSGCSLMVNSGVNVTVNSGHTLTITNQVTTSGTLIFEDTASLVQINNVVNTGNITYKRKTTPITRMDYTYWSSPVSPYTLGGVSPNTSRSKLYSYNSVADNWKQESPATSMTKGIGYIIRGPENYVTPMVLPAQYEASFIGVPNNGNISLPVTVTGKSYLIGNPYPSSLDGDVFLNDNAAVLDGTLYFWTHKTPIGTNVSNPGSGIYAYSGDDYASYNLVGGVSTVPGTPAPTGKIAAGQGFFTTSIATGIIQFDNNMRVGGNNANFYKTKNKKTTIEKNRIWLNFSNTQGAFKQMLVGYVTGATNNLDSRFDGESFDGNAHVDFYSVNQNKKFVIQGRALPFDETDEIPLGFRTTINGLFTINIEQVDGFLVNQDVFLEDKLTSKVINLKEGSYTFSTEKGTFNNRFVLKYSNKTLSNPDFDTQANKVLVSCKDKQIAIHSFAETIDKITIYDTAGRQIYQNNNINSNEFLITDLISSHQVLIVKTSLQNGTIATNKIIY